MLMRQMADHQAAAHSDSAAPLRARADALDRHADALRALVTDGEGFSVKP